MKKIVHIYIYIKSREKVMEQSKEIKQNWTGSKDFDICFCVIFTAMIKIFISGRETEQ